MTLTPSLRLAPLFVVLLATPPRALSDSPPGTEQRKGVLIMLPSQAGRPVIEDLLRSIDSQLGSSTGSRVSLYVEYMGEPDFHSGGLDRNKREDLNRRYAVRKLDAIIAIGDDSLWAIEDVYRSKRPDRLLQVH